MRSSYDRTLRRRSALVLREFSGARVEQLDGFARCRYIDFHEKRKLMAGANGEYWKTRFLEAEPEEGCCEFMINLEDETDPLLGTERLYVLDDPSDTSGLS